MFKTLYRGSHLVAALTLAAIVGSASAAAALHRAPSVVAQDCATAPFVGRFIVGPQVSEFVPPASGKTAPPAACAG